MTTYTVTARRSRPGWELWISEAGEHVGVSSARKLGDAEQAARDYVETLRDRDASADAFEVIPDLDGLEKDVIRAREHNLRAQRETRDAAAESRKLARQLRAAGLSGADTAAVLGVTKGRVSQLVR